MSTKPKKETRPLIAVNLRSARLAAGFESISDAARFIGIPIPTAVAHEGSAVSFRRPKLEQLRKYAMAYNTTIDALEGGTIVEPGYAPRVKMRELEVTPSLMGVPILGTAQAGAWREVDPFASEQLGMAYALRRDDAIFAVNIAGDSMNRIIQDGDCVIVRPWQTLHRDPRQNEIVLVQRERDGRFELTVKTYRDGELWPESTNPKWRHPVAMRDGDEVTFIGLVVGLYRPL